MPHARRPDGATAYSPQRFYTGLRWAYGIDGPAQGHCRVDLASGYLARSTPASECPVLMV